MPWRFTEKIKRKAKQLDIQKRSQSEDRHLGRRRQTLRPTGDRGSRQTEEVSDSRQTPWPSQKELKTEKVVKGHLEEMLKVSFLLFLGILLVLPLFFFFTFVPPAFGMTTMQVS